MKHKKEILEKLKKELLKLKEKRELLLNKLNESRNQYNEEYESPIIEDTIVELQGVVSQICDYENTLKTMNKKNPKNDNVEVGDCITLKNHTHSKQFCIAKKSDYINPDLGIISSDSPMGKKLLSKKIGDKINITLNGNDIEYKITT